MKVLIILSLVLVSVRAVPEFCLKEPDYGNCSKRIQLWGYSRSGRQCISFEYSGCGGNYNRFPTKERCFDICVNPYDIEVY